MKSRRLIRTAIWPLAIASALAVAIACMNPEARHPSPLAKHLPRAEYQVALRPIEEAEAEPLREEALPTLGLPRDISSRTRTGPPSSRDSQIIARSETATPKRSPTVKVIPRATPVEVSSTDEITTSNTHNVGGPQIFIEASRSESTPRQRQTPSRKPVVSLGPMLESVEENEQTRGAASPRSVEPTAVVSQKNATLPSDSPETAAITPLNVYSRENNDVAVFAAALAGRMESARLETQLVNLQRQVEQLTQQKDQDQNAAMQRTLQLLDKLEQTTQLQELHRRLDQLQNTLPNQATVAAKSEGTGPIDAEKPATEKPPAAKPGPILKAEPNPGAGERLNLTIQDADVTEVLKMLGEISSVNILVGKGVKGNVTANLQDVTVEQALAGILRSLDCMFERDGRFIFVMTDAEAEARKKAGRKLITKVYRPNYISVADLQALVTPLLTPSAGKVAVTLPPEVGIAPDNKTTGGNRIAQQDALLVMDYPEVIQEVDNVLLEMDVPPMQVVIETMILSVSLDDSMEFGVNFALLSGQNKDLFLNGNGRTLNGGSGFPGTGSSIVPPGTQFLADTAGLKYGFLRGDMSMFLNALEEIADTNVIASPQLRVLNKQKAELIIGEKLSYTTTTFNQTQTIENVQFLDVGTKLILRPYVSPDGLVRMEIHPERSSGSINPQTQLPDLETTEVTTNVMVRDGTTVVIGGLIEEKTEESQQRVPFLGAIPLVGNVFKNKTEKQTRSELIVLITPRIVTEPEDALEGESLRFEHEERAEHFRENLSPVNRRNLARMEYERAFDLYEQGDLVRARMHIHRALRHSKNDVNAIRLRDQIEQALYENTRRILSFGTAGESIDADEALPLPSVFEEVESPAEPTGKSAPSAEDVESLFNIPPAPGSASKRAPKLN